MILAGRAGWLRHFGARKTARALSDADLALAWSAIARWRARLA